MIRNQNKINRAKNLNLMQLETNLNLFIVTEESVSLGKNLHYND